MLFLVAQLRGPIADGARRMARTSVFAAGENLGAGRIHFARAFKITGSPLCAKAHNGRLGDIAEYPGMSAFFNLH